MITEITKQKKLIQEFVRSGVFENAPFTLCNIDPLGEFGNTWRLFEPFLNVISFHPNADVCRKLQFEELNKKISYYPFLIGSQEQEKAPKTESGYFNFWDRTCYSQLENNLKGKLGDNSSIEEPVKIPLEMFVNTNAITSIDFIRITCGKDALNILKTTENIIKKCDVLGFLVEVSFVSTKEDAKPTITEINHWMTKQGFLFYDFIEPKKYPKASLPAPISKNHLQEAGWGQLVKANALYLRDGASSHYQEFWKESLRLDQILKLVALFDFFNLPDCAAELIISKKAEIQQLLNIDTLLNLLVPMGHGNIDYQTYLNYYQNNPELFYPEKSKIHQNITKELESSYRRLKLTMKKLKVRELWWY